MLLYFKAICKLPIHHGNCEGDFNRYHFDAFTKRCEIFSYTGCGGNENNFLTADLCNETCFFTIDDNNESKQFSLNIVQIQLVC